MADDAAAGREAFQLDTVGAAAVDMDAMQAENGDGMHAEPTGRGGGGDAMEDDDEYGRPAKRAARGPEPGSAAAILYGEAGQLNPNIARQERKKLKKRADRAEVVAAAIAAKEAKLRREMEAEDSSSDEGEAGSGDDPDGGASGAMSD
eukprot:120436-Chlamydomonas_euryale.AAC.8